MLFSSQFVKLSLKLSINFVLIDILLTACELYSQDIIYNTIDKKILYGKKYTSFWNVPAVISEKNCYADCEKLKLQWNKHENLASMPCAPIPL